MYSRRKTHLISENTDTHAARFKEKKKNSLKAELLIDLFQNGSALRRVCVEKGRWWEDLRQSGHVEKPVPFLKYLCNQGELETKVTISPEKIFLEKKEHYNIHLYTLCVGFIVTVGSKLMC